MLFYYYALELRDAEVVGLPRALRDGPQTTKTGGNSSQDVAGLLPLGNVGNELFNAHIHRELVRARWNEELVTAGAGAVGAHGFVGARPDWFGSEGPGPRFAFRNNDQVRAAKVDERPTGGRCRDLDRAFDALRAGCSADEKWERDD